MGAPTENGMHAVTKAHNEAKGVINGINAFFSGDWKDYVDKIKELPMDIFKEIEEVKIE